MENAKGQGDKERKTNGHQMQGVGSLEREKNGNMRMGTVTGFGGRAKYQSYYAGTGVVHPQYCSLLPHQIP